MARRVALTLALVLFVGCGGAATDSDGGAQTAPDAGTVDASMMCASDVRCDDGVFCNGAERCNAHDPRADAHGCTPGVTPCSAGQTCVEASRTCMAAACTTPDGDADGVLGIACGGADCDDTDADRHPGDPERCDASAPGHDEDCDPCTVASTTGDGDADGDGYVSVACANPFTSGTPTCDPAATHVDVAGSRVTGVDCDDSNANVHPAQPEACNGVDDDCDTMIDEGVLLAFYVDGDGDGFGAMGSTPMMACTAPPGYVDNALDCADADQTRNPATTEICNGLDDDCDGVPDDASATTIYVDADGDGHGDPTQSSPGASCVAPAGYAIVGDDCDDANAIVHPGAVEICDGLDDDCSAGGGPDTTEDADGDGHAPPSAACTGGDPKDDCDDTRALTYGGALERCDGLDDDCDGVTDESAAAAAFCGTGATCNAGLCTSDAGISAGGAFSCAIRFPAPGAVVCWGDDYVAQAGDGPPSSSRPTIRPTPTAATGLSDAVEIASGDATTCARRASGAVVCWGDLVVVPTAVAGVANAVQLTVGGALVGTGGPPTVGTSCARLLDGTVSCWPLSGAATPVAGLSDVVEIRAGAGHVCARSTDATVRCWGANTHGQLGDGTTTDQTAPVVVGGLVAPVQIATGTSSTCARQSDRTVVCWGSNAYGELGDGTHTERHAPTPVVGLTDAIDLVARGSHVCARHAAGGWSCWGNNLNGQLGDGTTTSRAAPVDVAGIGDAVGLAAGATTFGRQSLCSPAVAPWFEPCGDAVTETCRFPPDDGCFEHTCARLATGEVACWGSGSLAELGDARWDGAYATPHDVAGVDHVVDVAAGDHHVCAARDTGEVVCWGDGRDGELGDGLGAGGDGTPVTVSSVVDAVAVAAGRAHSCAMRLGGGVVCWGDDGFGQVGDGAAIGTGALTARDVVGVTDAVQIAAAGDQTCVRRAGGAVACWGANFTGQLGDGTGANTSTPVSVYGLTDAIDVAVGPFDTCAVRADGSAQCWGLGENGELGDGLFTTSFVPVDVATLTGAVSVAAVEQDCCALTAGGDEWCWGGVGTPYDLGVVGVAQLVGSGAAWCERLVSGVVTCRARNIAGSIASISGDGRFLVSYGGTNVLGVTDATDLAVAAASACVVRGSGVVACWGTNRFGELGSPVGVDRATPFVVPGLP